jgi:hypothetical protein
MINAPICQEPFDGLPIRLRRIANLVTHSGDSHFVSLGRRDAHASSFLAASETLPIDE